MSLTRYEEAGKKAIDAFLRSHNDQEVVSLWSLSVEADSAARYSGKKTDLYKSLFDYLNLIRSDSGWQWYDSGSEFKVRNPYYHGKRTVILHGGMK